MGRRLFFFLFFFPSFRVWHFRVLLGMVESVLTPFYLKRKDKKKIALYLRCVPCRPPPILRVSAIQGRSVPVTGEKDSGRDWREIQSWSQRKNTKQNKKCWRKAGNLIVVNSSWRTNRHDSDDTVRFYFKKKKKTEIFSPLFWGEKKKKKTFISSLNNNIARLYLYTDIYVLYVSQFILSNFV